MTGEAGGLADAAKTQSPPLAAAAEESPHLAVVQPRKVVYTADLEVLVGDVKVAVEATKALAEKMGGYMQRMTGSAIVIRVPADRFDQAIAALAQMGTITRKDVTAQDVTERYTDLEIRLKNNKVLLEKLRALLDKATTAKEALEVEQEIARVTTEIERLEGQLNRLASQIAYATLAVTFRPVEQAPEELKFKLPFWWLHTLGLERLLAW